MPDESYAVMQGQFTRHIGRELYEFKGTDGETIVADLDDDANWSFIRPGIRFEIAGEVDRDAYGIKFEVHSAKPLVK